MPGNIRTLPVYFRPTVAQVKYTPGELADRKAQMEQLDGAMWVASRRKRYLGRGYTTVVLWQRGKDHYYVEIPTNAKGVVPKEAMAARLMDSADGDRESHMRNVMVDLSVTAKKRVKDTDLAGTYRWFLHPNESDVRYLDDTNTKLVQVLKKMKDGSRRTLIIMGGTESQREQLAQSIKANFTVREKRLLAGTIFEIKNLGGRGYAGQFVRMATMDDAPIGTTRVQIAPEYCGTPEVVVHEAIHALRYADDKRPMALRYHEHTPLGRDVDVEESLTEAETFTRETPFTGDESTIGYAQFLPEAKAARQKGAYTEREQIIKAAKRDDRVTLVQPKDPEQYRRKGKKGKRAEQALLKQFPQTHIAHLNISGRGEAIDKFFRLREAADKAQGGVKARMLQVHVYSPEGRVGQGKRVDHAIKRQATEVAEWRDGKLVPIKGKVPRFRRRAPSISGKREIRITPRRPRLT